MGRRLGTDDVDPVLAERSEPAGARRSRPGLFEVVFGLLSLHFASLAVTYLVDPGYAVRQFSRANEWLGGIAFAPPDVTAWRYATVCGMATLAVMTSLVLIDLRRNHPLVIPAAFFKVLNAILWFWYSASNSGLPVFAVAGVFDLVVVAIMVFVARRELRGLGAANPARQGGW